MSEFALYRRLLRQARPYWLHLTVLFAIGLLIAVAALAQVQGLANKFMQAYVGERLVLAFRTRLVQHAQRLSLSYHDSKGSADSLYRINQDAAVIDKIMVEGIIPFVAAGITLAMMIVVMTRL